MNSKSIKNGLILRIHIHSSWTKGSILKGALNMKKLKKSIEKEESVEAYCLMPSHADRAKKFKDNTSNKTRKKESENKSGVVTAVVFSKRGKK